MKINSIKDAIYPLCALYVEDNEEVRRQTAKILKLFFHQVIDCGDGREGIDKFKASKAGIVFTDINMPGINGLEMIKPFTTEDLLSVLEKITQSIEMKPGKFIYLSGDFVWDKQSLTLCKAGEIIKLTKNETSLLQLLLSSSGRIASGLEIENELFEDYGGYDDKRVRNIVSRFHRKIGYKLIENIYSQGYRIKWR